MQNCETCFRAKAIDALKKECFSKDSLQEQELWCTKCLDDFNKSYPYWLSEGEPKMDLHTARLIRQVKKNCTYRRLAEIYYPEHYFGYGNQLTGESLCRDALSTLYPNDDVWMMYEPKEKFGEKWHQENLSNVGDFYWWE